MFAGTKVLVIAVTVGLVALVLKVDEVAAIYCALGLPLLVGLSALVLRIAWPAQHENIGLQVLRFLGASLSSLCAWGALFTLGFAVVKGLSPDAYGPGFFFIGAAFAIGPLSVSTAGLLVLFRLGPGQRSPF